MKLTVHDIPTVQRLEGIAECQAGSKDVFLLTRE